jgi:hypothetical protein
MKRLVLAVMTALGMLAFGQKAEAVSCANGVYRAGCAGPNGAAVVRKPYATRPPTYYAPRHPVSCANGVYRAGCAGPNGAVVVRKRY